MTVHKMVLILEYQFVYTLCNNLYGRLFRYWNGGNLIYPRQFAGTFMSLSLFLGRFWDNSQSKIVPSVNSEELNTSQSAKYRTKQIGESAVKKIARLISISSI